jgi:WD40 repeat protein
MTLHDLATGRARWTVRDELSVQLWETPWFLADGNVLVIRIPGSPRDLDRTVTAQVRDGQTGALLRSFSVTTGTQTALDRAITLSPDRRTLAAAGREEGRLAVAFWDLASGRLDRVLKGSPVPAVDTIWAPALLPGGQGLAVSRSKANSSSATGQIRHLWDLASGRELSVQPKRRAEPESMTCLSPDGRRFVGWGPSRRGQAWSDSLRISDVATGQELLTLDSPDGMIMPGNVAFSPDGRRLVALAVHVPSHVCRLLVWDATPAQLEPMTAP